MNKKLLKTNELIGHCKEKGIKFDLISEEKAYDYLLNNSYYFKLASYRFNYQKHQDGVNKDKYINLDFAYLIDLYEIDSQLKCILFDMCLKIEQALKISILNYAELSPNEDGYKIMQKYETSNIVKGIDIYRSIKRIQSSSYAKCLCTKYAKSFPLWVYLELSSFGDILKFSNFYEKEEGFCFERTLLYNVKDLRNACAHNNCLINDLYKKNITPDKSVLKIIRDLNLVSKETLNKKMQNQFIYGFVCLLISYNKMVLNKNKKDDSVLIINNLFKKRILEHKEWYLNNNILTTSYNFLFKIIEYFSKNLV